MHRVIRKVFMGMAVMLGLYSDLVLLPFEEGLNIQEEEVFNKGEFFYECKELYEKFRTTLSIGDEYLIPQVIHFIWLGSPLPERCKVCIESWAKIHPDWVIRIWTDDDVEGFEMVNYVAFKNARNYGQKSDIWRYEILYRYGGLYLDTDFACLKKFDEIHRSCTFYTGISRCGETLLNGLIGSRPGHPIMMGCINAIKNTDTKSNFHEMMEETGPYFFSHQFRKAIHLVREEKTVVFPPIYFYPYPAIYRRMLDEEARDLFTEPESMAIHYWATSWQK